MTHTEIESSNNNYHPIVLDLLKKRGYEHNQIEDFFSWNLRDLPDLTKMHDLDLSAKRIISAMENNEKIGIYGDYDVDGTTSCALFYQFFQLHGVDVELFQPSRFVEGYGVHPSSIENAIEKGVKLLITVDCGISNVETADYAKDRNLDLIITDHHKDTREHIPRAYAVVNPNRRDEENKELKALAGVGVAFAVCLQIKNILDARKSKDEEKTPSIYPLLQYVAIGTICDLAHLNPMNLKMTRHGLKQIIDTEYKGVEAFFNDEDRSAPFIPSEKISFYVGPLINSKGRLDHPEKALNLLISKDHKTAFENYSHLEISNRERKLIQHDVYVEAKKMVIKDINRNDHLISVVYAPDWHEGVIGIVASKLVETFNVPALVFSNSEEKGIIKASCRSAGELDLYALLKSCEDLFLKFGGHKAACGLSMEKENLYKLKDRLNEKLKEVPEIVRTKQEYFDAEISFNDISAKLVREFDKMEPFGMGNEKPLLRMRDAKIDSYTLLKDIHVKWFFTHKSQPKNKIQGISFNYIGKWNTPTPDELYQWQKEGDILIYFRLGINRFRGNETIQLMVERVTKA